MSGRAVRQYWENRVDNLYNNLVNFPHKPDIRLLAKQHQEVFDSMGLGNPSSRANGDWTKILVARLELASLAGVCCKFCRRTVRRRQDQAKFFKAKES
jgi:hypothetical protein